MTAYQCRPLDTLLASDSGLCDFPSGFTGQCAADFLAMSPVHLRCISRDIRILDVCTNVIFMLAM